MRLASTGIMFLAAAAIAAPPLLAETASKSGEQVFEKCASCHSLEPGTVISAPSLYGIVGRKVAASPGFDYTPALRGFAQTHPVWTAELIRRFVENSDELVPGTAMDFGGVADPKDRAALIDYLSAAAKKR